MVALPAAATCVERASAKSTLRLGWRSSSRCRPPSHPVLCCVWHYNPPPSRHAIHPTVSIFLPTHSPLLSSLFSFFKIHPSSSPISNPATLLPLCFQVKYVSPKSEVAHPQRSQKRHLALLLLNKNFPSSSHLSERGKKRQKRHLQTRRIIHFSLSNCGGGGAMPAFGGGNEVGRRRDGRSIPGWPTDRTPTSLQASPSCEDGYE